MDFLTELGDSLEKLKETVDDYLSEKYEEELPTIKFTNPSSFTQYAWNISRPSREALLIYLHKIKDEIYMRKQMKELCEVLEKHPMFGVKLWEMLNRKAGETHKEKAAFIEENIALVTEPV